MKHLLLVSVMALSGCVSEVQANFMIAEAPERVTNCVYVGAFKTHLDGDGVPETLASAAERRQSTQDMWIVRDRGANTILRVETTPAPLVTVSAYRCLGWVHLSGQI
jgi:hypothetical protein